MSCPRCSHCSDLTSPAALEFGRQVPVFRQSRTAMLLQVAAPPGALERLLQWVEGLRGKAGPSRLEVTLVAHDQEWTKLEVERAPEVFGRRRASVES